jgi:hypothetical protein
MSAVIPDPALTDWVPLYNLGAPSGLVMVEDKLLTVDGAIDFTGIPATFKHLRLLASLRSAQATVAGASCRFNGDSGGNYDVPPTQNQTSIPLMGFLPGTDRVAGVHGLVEIDIVDYASILHHRGASFRAGWYDGTSTITEDKIGHWKNLAAAINRIQLIPAAGIFAAGSRATLYALTDVPVSLATSSILELVAERVTPKTNTGLIAALAEYNFDGGKYWIEAFTTVLAGTTTSGGGGGGNMSAQLRRTPSGGAAAVMETWQVIGPSASSYPMWHVKHRIQPPAGLATLDWWIECTGTQTGNQVEATAGKPAWIRLSR